MQQLKDGGTEEFSMIAGKVRSKKEHLYDDGKIKLLKFAAVYGANAAGKSNLIKAMDFMRRVIVLGLPDGYTEKFCKIDPNNADEPSYFEMEILLNGKYYAYGFEVILSKSKFVSEWLVELHADDTEKVLFERDVINSVYELGGELATKGLKEKLDVYAGDIQNDGTALFLSVMNQNKKTLYENSEQVAILKDVFMWFLSSLDINYPDRPVSNYSYLARANADEVSEICRIMSAFGTGITDFQLSDVPIENCASHSRYFSDELDAQNSHQKKEQMFDIFLCIWYTIFMKKDMFTINKNGLSYGRGYVYSLQYHLVWCTKYRKKVLKDGIDVECKEMLESLAQEYKFQILAMEVMSDHIHLLVDCRPQFYISDMIKIMKGNLARQMFLLYPELKKELWGGHLWNPSYCAVTVSDRSREQVLAYIEGQKEKSR